MSWFVFMSPSLHPDQSQRRDSVQLLVLQAQVRDDSFRRLVHAGRKLPMSVWRARTARSFL